MLAVTDIRIPEKCRAALVAHGFSVVPLPPFSALEPKVASHPDMLILPLGDRLFVHKDYYAEAQNEIDTIVNHTSALLTLTEDKVAAEYPFDVALNVVAVGNKILCRRGSISQAVATYATEKGFTIADTKQGYAKCSTVVLGNSGIITADPSIEKVARAHSIDVLRVSEGHVALAGYDHGFIGGASGVYQNTVFFSGDITKHPDGKTITEFCRAIGFEVVSLSDEPLYDVGSIFLFS